MMERIRQGWTWFVGGLAEALLWLIDRGQRASSHRLVFGDGDAAIHTAGGAVLARVVDRDGAKHIEPVGAAARLAGVPLDILVPSAWLFRRSLDPVALQSVPFLDVFVRHHIERITPWRAPDVHYVIHQKPLASDPTRVAVDVSLVPKRLVQTWVDALQPLHPRRLRLVSQDAPQDAAGAIDIGGGAARRLATIRDRLTLGLGVVVLCFVGLIGWLSWQTAAVENEIADQDQILAERQAVLARAHGQNQGGNGVDAQLAQIRDAGPRIVGVIDALAKALPDSSHLTNLTIHKGQMTIAGVSADTSLLVPALEKSGLFTDVAYGASTTKIESGRGDRFQLDMRIRPVAPGSR